MACAPRRTLYLAQAGRIGGRPRPLEGVPGRLRPLFGGPYSPRCRKRPMMKFPAMLPFVVLALAGCSGRPPGSKPSVWDKSHPAALATTFPREAQAPKGAAELQFSRYLWLAQGGLLED